jgi:hypothetical protein
MRKLCLSVIGLFLLLFEGFGQSETDSKYKKLTLSVDEVNLVSSYYSQTGNHSPITGGIGTQQLTDVSNVVQLHFSKYDLFEKKHSFELEIGLDHHTAASSAYVSKTGASKTGGTRFYPSMNWKVEDETKGSTIGWGFSYSNEYNYKSYGANLNFSQLSSDRNREFNIKGQIYLDRVKLIQPSEFQPAVTTPTTQVITSASGRRTTLFSGSSGASSGIPSSSRNTFDVSASLSQVISKRLQVAVLADAVAQSGYLGLPFHRVYLTSGKVAIENLPTSRIKIPVGLRVHYYAGDNLIIRGYYRYYQDDWGVKAHTVSLEAPYKISPFVSISPFARFYTQTASTYFAPYMQHTTTDKYYTSNYEYAQMQSQYVGVNFRAAPPKGIFGAQKFSMIELRVGHYVQTTGLEANNIGLNFRFK